MSNLLSINPDARPPCTFEGKMVALAGKRLILSGSFIVLLIVLLFYYHFCHTHKNIHLKFKKRDEARKPKKAHKAYE